MTAEQFVNDLLFEIKVAVTTARGKMRRVDATSKTEMQEFMILSLQYMDTYIRDYCERKGIKPLKYKL